MQLFRRLGDLSARPDVVYLLCPLLCDACLSGPVKSWRAPPRLGLRGGTKVHGLMAHGIRGRSLVSPTRTISPPTVPRAVFQQPNPRTRLLPPILFSVFLDFSWGSSGFPVLVSSFFCYILGQQAMDDEDLEAAANGDPGASLAHYL